jgi:Protein of unknown function (DUF3093)
MQSVKSEPGQFEERLTAPVVWWFIALCGGLMVGLVFLRYSMPLALGGLAVGTALSGALVVAYGRIGVSVRDGFLEAGEARLPLSALGDVAVLDPEQARELRTTGADMRAFMLLRGYVSTAVRVEVTDPEDPTPYLYLSTRRPQELALALGSPA